MPTFTPDEEKAWEINNTEDKGSLTTSFPLTNAYLVENTHYDPNAEIRTRGVGHYTFSTDASARAAEMAALNAARDKTEAEREQAKKAADTRRAKIEERRREIAGKKRKREADRFLSGLGLELQGGD
jgi:Domain of unknown function (DUF4078)